MVIQANSSNYWISPTALHITLNAMDNVDYIHANASGDASILVYISGVIDYDNAHNYRKFPITLSSTAFGSPDSKYVYVAIPRTLDNTVPSIVVFPSKPISVYGKEIITNPDNTLSEGAQLGDEKYFYIFLQGIISASETATSVVKREWTHEIETGTLATSEASNTGGDSTWWLYNAVTELVTFTKTIASATIKALKIDRLIFGNGEVSSVADTAAYNDTDNNSLVTPKFLNFFGNKSYLSKQNDDSAAGVVDFEKGIKIKGNAITDIIKSGDDIQNTDTLIMSVAKQLATFMRKDAEDSTDFIQTFTKGIKALLVQSGNYTTGMLGAGFTLKNDANGDSYIEVDRGLFRKTVTFYELLIQKIKSVGGQILLSPTQMNCIKVEEQADSYRCYFKNNEDGKVIYNEFEVNDLARRQDFNVKTGSKYYWRKVIAIGDDYIDLSKTDCDAGSGVPEVGDDIIQIGNSSDTARQGAIVLSAYGPDSPYIKIYQGINSYMLSGKERATLSPSKIDITADSFKFSTGDSIKDYIDNNVIVPCGNWEPGTSYLKNRLVTFNNQTFISTADTSDCPIVVLADENGDYLVDENGDYITPTDENGNIAYNPSWKAYSSSEALEQDVAKFKKDTSATFEILNDKIDSKVSSTTYNALNDVVEQHTTEFKQLPDSFNMSITESVKEGGTVYDAINSSFTMNDDGITLFGKKLNFSGSAIFQDINKNIQSKAHTFTSQPTDADAYNVGDIWTNATYGDTFKNDILKCVTAKVAGAAFDIAHWQVASKYTDDTVAKQAQTDAKSALDYREDFAKNLGYASLADMENAAQTQHVTIIHGGKINTALLEVDTILFNALNGKTVDAQNATIQNLNVNNVNLSGNFRSPMYYADGIPNAKYNNNICITGGSNITLIDKVENVGRLIRIIYSYKSDGTLSTGRSTIKTSGSKIYEDGVPNDSIIINREMVELLGMGNDTTFFGWQVLNRIDTVTEHSYGRKLKVIAEGVVTGSSTGASIRGRCWDSRIDFAVSRQGVGIYVIAFTSEINIDSANDIIVMATGIGHAAEDGGSAFSPIKATVAEVVVVNGTLTVTIITSDDATANDGSFNFMITNMNDFGVE